MIDSVGNCQKILAQSNKRRGQISEIHSVIFHTCLSAFRTQGGTNFTNQNQAPVRWNIRGDMWRAVPRTSKNNAFHSQSIMNNNIVLIAQVLMWLCVKCRCCSLCQLLQWQSLKLSLLCRYLFCICYVLCKLLVTDCPKLLCLKALNSLALRKRTWAFWKTRVPQVIRVDYTSPEQSFCFPAYWQFPQVISVLISNALDTFNNKCPNSYISIQIKFEIYFYYFSFVLFCIV